MINKQLRGHVIMIDDDINAPFRINYILDEIMLKKRNYYDLVILDEYCCEYAEKYKLANNNKTLERLDCPIITDNPTITLFSMPSNKFTPNVVKSVKNMKDTDIIIIQSEKDSKNYKSLKKLSNVEFKVDKCNKTMDFIDLDGEVIFSIKKRPLAH